MDLKRFIYGIIWFVLFIYLFYSITGTVLVMRSNPGNLSEISPDQIRHTLEIFTRRYNNLSLLGPFLIAMIGTALGILPGTRRRAHLQSLDQESTAVFPSAEQALGLIFFLVTAQFGISILAGSAFELLGRKDLLADPLISSAPPLIAAACTILYCFKKSRGRENTTIEARPFPRILPLAILPAIFGLIIVLSETDNLIRAWFPPPELSYDPATILPPGISLFLLFVIISPILEEFLFRGIISGGLSRNHTFGRALVLSSFFYAFVHLNPYQLIPAFGMGLIFGWIYYFSRNIWLCVFLNAVTKAISYILARGVITITIPGFTIDPMNPAAHSFQPVWFDLLGIGLLAGGIYWTARVLNSLEPAPGSAPAPQQ